MQHFCGFHSIFPHYEATLVQTPCSYEPAIFQDMPKLQMEHTHIIKKTLRNNDTCYTLIPGNRSSCYQQQCHLAFTLATVWMHHIYISDY
jgi:hypothetical protein